MKIMKFHTTIVALRLCLGLVVLAQSLIFIFGRESAQFFARHGFPNVMRLALGWAEFAAALLFLLPVTTAIGGWVLIAVFSLAILFHLIHGQFEVGGLLVYATAALVVLAHRPPREVERET